MKTILITSFISFATLYSYSQTEKSFIVIPCLSGNLFIDGNNVGKIEANDASSQKLSNGDHYLQLKTTSQKFNLQVTITDTSKSIIKLGCSDAIGTGAISLFDKEISLTGLLGGDVEQSTLGLDYGDELLINSSIINKKGNATIFITAYEDKTEIYRKESFNSIVDQKIRIPKKGIYTVSIYTDALFGKSAKLTIHRIPASASTASFKTTTRKVYDTTSQEVLNNTVRVYSVTNLDHPNKTTVKVNLPANTTYWVYWIGVGQESRDKMKSFASNVASASKFISTNPLILYGMKLIPSLPMLNSKSTVNYRFTDTPNSQLCLRGAPYSYYTFKYGSNVAIDYSTVQYALNDLVLNLSNESSVIGEDVEVKVVAFMVKSKLVMDE